MIGRTENIIDELAYSRVNTKNDGRGKIKTIV